MSSSTPLLETAYWPPIAWLQALWHSETAAIEAAEHYQKGSWRNRCHIAGPNGLQRLSVPLEKGKHRQMPIREVRIAYDEPWRQQHWRSIRTAYGNAPYFEHYEAAIARIYERQHIFLFDLNAEIIHFILSKMSWRGRLSHTDTFYPLGQWPGGSDCRAALPEHPARPYPQVFTEKHGFIPHLSGLDLLMCVGKRGGELFTESPLP